MRLGEFHFTMRVFMQISNLLDSISKVELIQRRRITKVEPQYIWQLFGIHLSTKYSSLKSGDRRSIDELKNAKAKLNEPDNLGITPGMYLCKI